MTEKRHPKQRDTQAPQQRRLIKRGSADDVSGRTKSSGHGKKTADKWNQ